MSEDKLILGLILTQFAVLLGKIIFDWLKEGRLSAGEYLLKSEFERHRKECCVLDIKKELTEYKRTGGMHDSHVDQKLSNMQKDLDRGSRNFDKMEENIANINKSLARITVVLEMKFGYAEAPNRRHTDQSDKGIDNDTI